MTEIQLDVTSLMSPNVMHSLTAGCIVKLSGVIYTARDAAHKRLCDTLAQKKVLPIDLCGALIFYAGPCPAKDDRIIGSIAATTSARMDVFQEQLFRAGVLGSIGKGERSAESAALHKKYSRIYFLSTGGAAALNTKYITKCEVVAYEDLGTESIKKLTIREMPLIVGIDCAGRDFCKEQRKIYRRG
ncbi:MAG: Fe-S-containing hydro-lyase [Treponemataceae bacterium]|nr:MAG: Fe-S-containing hydro-lyase [Treponemataceae bacterium]